MTQPRNVIIVGSGPAGYTAALYTARADLQPLLFEGSQFGGALMTTTDVENYPGFPDGIMGPDLMAKMRAQAERFGAEIVSDDVTSVDLTGPIKTVRTHSDEYTADTVILAMGSAYRKLGIPREDQLSGHGVSWCATCDGFFFRDKDIAVVGGGDTAMEVSGEGAVSGIRLRDTVTGAERDLAVQGLFIAIGHEPRSDLVKGQVDLDAEGYILTEAGSTKTNLDGVFAAGDVVDHTYRQAVTAAGTGCQAALDAERFLSRLHDLAGVPAPSGMPD